MAEKKGINILKKILYIISIIIRMALVAFITYIGIIFTFLIAVSELKLWQVTGVFLTILLFAILFVAFFPKKNIKKKLIGLGIIFGITALLFLVNFGIVKYKESITIDVNVNINNDEYRPFDEKSKIVKLDHEASLRLTDNLPIVDGATALFPVYSAYVNAVYPSDIEVAEHFNRGVIVYNSTSAGYRALAKGETDIFFGAYPSEEQIEYAKSLGNEFEFTQIGSEAFVFFVNKKNPVDNLTIDEIRKIYGGEITNWSEVGGKDIDIAAYQRNKSSGSQSMFERFMEGYHIMEPPQEQVYDNMMGIVYGVVSDYQNTDAAIGYSFRYYLDTLVNNPKVKMLSVDGAYPDIENIKNGSYKIVTPVYAVTVKGNDNPNVKLLLDWVLSEEGQEILEKTGYVGVK